MLKKSFSASPGKTMQNHLEFSSKSQFWIRNVEIGGKHKEHIFFESIFMKIHLFASRQWFFMVLACSWVSWPKNNVERSRNFFEKQILNPKHAKLWFLRAISLFFFEAPTRTGPQLGLGPNPGPGLWHACKKNLWS